MVWTEKALHNIKMFEFASKTLGLSEALAGSTGYLTVDCDSQCVLVFRPAALAVNVEAAGVAPIVCVAGLW